MSVNPEFIADGIDFYPTTPDAAYFNAADGKNKVNRIMVTQKIYTTPLHRVAVDHLFQSTLMLPRPIQKKVNRAAWKTTLKKTNIFVTFFPLN